MQKRLYQFMLLLTMIAVILAGTTTVYADDGTTGGETTEPTSAEEQPAEESIPEETVEQILEQIPEGTEVVVLSEDGVEPLASEEAAQIILEDDPMWCPGSHIPGDVECTAGDLNVTALLSAIAALPIADRTGAGTIYFTSNYAVADAAFDHTDPALSLITDLTIQGGWNGGTGGGFGLSGVTTFNGVSLTIANWTGNITINDIDIAAAGNNAGFGLFVDNTGDVTLDNVSVSSTPLNSFNKGDGAIINTTGNVDISNSDFNNNQGNGLQVTTTGTIDLDTVSASNNTLTGAFLDSCRYGSVTAGLCAGNGAVSIIGVSLFSNLFNDNQSGLIIDAGGGIAIDHVQANSNDLSGAVLTSLDDDGTGNVIVDQSEFNDNSNGTGLNVLTDGSIAITDIDAFSNRSGTILDTINGTGGINVSDSDFGMDNTTGNTWTGLHAESGDTIDLSNVVASYNGSNGAYLTAEGNITVANSTFDENVNSNFPEDPGLYAKSHGGDITINNVAANGNEFGAGGVLMTSGTGVINVTGGQYNTNGTIGLQAQSENGNITLATIVASYNAVKGAYLSAYGSGQVNVNDSNFVENGSYGIYASTSSGDLNLTNDTVTGNGVTDYGAVLIGPNVFVTDSTFNTNTEVGLKIIASETVELNNVTADGNGGNGVEVYSTSTDGPVCPDEEVVNIIVNVDGGTFTNNGEYGLMVKPGPEGDLVFVTPSTFGGNGLGEYLLDLGEPETKDCTEDKEPSEPKDPKVVQVPPTGGDPVEQECDLFSSTVLELPNGTWVNVGCPFSGFSNLEELLQDNLPGPLGAGLNFAAAVTVSLTDEDGNATLNEDGTITINFKIPEDSRARGYSILFWDPTLNDGEGGWVEMPLFEAGTSFRLNPDDPDDERTIISGVQQIGDIMTITVNFPGIFVLVTR